MCKTTKRLLIGGIVLLVIGLVFATGQFHFEGGAAATYTLLPIGSIFLGMFLVMRVLHNENAKYDEDQKAISDAAGVESH